MTAAPRANATPKRARHVAAAAGDAPRANATPKRARHVAAAASDVEAAIGLGSNVGNRAAHLRFAFRELNRLAETHVVRRSKVLRSTAVGPGRQREFLNAAALIRTRLSPMGLLVGLKRLEALRGRRPGRRWSPRTLDLDILSYGKLKLRSVFLTLPHPAARRRRFVSGPLAQVRRRAG